ACGRRPGGNGPAGGGEVSSVSSDVGCKNSLRTLPPGEPSGQGVSSDGFVGQQPSEEAAGQPTDASLNTQASAYRLVSDPALLACVRVAVDEGPWSGWTSKRRASTPWPRRRLKRPRHSILTRRAALASLRC